MTCLTLLKPRTSCVNCGIAQLTRDFKQDTKKTQIPTRKENIHIINPWGTSSDNFPSHKNTAEKKTLWPLKKTIYLVPLPLSMLLLHATKYGNFSMFLHGTRSYTAQCHTDTPGNKWAFNVNQVKVHSSVYTCCTCLAFQQYKEENKMQVICNCKN